MQSINQFNALNGTNVYRSDIERIVDLAKKEEQFDVSKRLQQILFDNPTKNEFRIDLVFPAIEK